MRGLNLRHQQVPSEKTETQEQKGGIRLNKEKGKGIKTTGDQMLQL